ncbi:hypothetical protein [Streptomyces nigra]|uniref:hypothetical protein n=1 Tax=Streptomyces nigra TaxID=1827580 RepID=UPI0030D26A56
MIAALGALAPELTAPVVTEELRLRQYERAANLAQWIATAAEDLADGLRGHMQRSGGDR